MIIRPLALSCLILCLLIFANGQLYFYHTDPKTINRSPVFFDCLYYNVLENIVNYHDDGLTNFKPTHQVIPYCMRPRNKQNNSENDLTNSTSLTFDYMQRNGIGVNDLLLWSAAIELVERYQEYIDHPTNLSSLEIFHNCTWPWFGSLCEYTFRLNTQSLESIVQAMFNAKEQTTINRLIPTLYNNLTCYTHLKCNRGPLPICLDWREICDGQIDCYDDGIDEKNCFQLESNQCEDNEFQCHNGMCIPSTFFGDSPFNFDCMDGTDEGGYDRMNTIVHNHQFCFRDPAFRCEELSYTRSVSHIFCGDGQTCYLDSKRCCENGRDRNKNVLSPDYLCYDEYRCPFILNPFYIDGLTCVKPDSINSYFSRTKADFFRMCLTIDTTGNETHCRDSSLFHCPNTSKCISKQRLVDGKLDCYYAADENFNGSCQLTHKASRFQCQSEEKCIPWINVMDTVPNCKDQGDEHLSTMQRDIFSFHIICNGFQHLDPILIENMNETDETNCEEWPCSNIYTRCDDGWTCLNGADELGCSNIWADLMDCSYNQRPCLSSWNLTMICLPLNKFNDTVIDCMGSLDELAHCRQQMMKTGDTLTTYKCWNDTSCTKPTINDIEDKCHFDKTIFNSCTPDDIDFILEMTAASDVMLRERPITKYFSLLYSNEYPSIVSSLATKTIDSESQMETSIFVDEKKINRKISIREAWYCNRGLPIRIGSKTIIHCLCPPSYYGTKCQFQSQRVSLTLQFQPVCSPECQGLFGIVVSLFDQMGTIHSQEIVTYIPQHDCQTKFNMNFLYRNRPKNETISYSLRIDAYNKSSNPLTYYSSWLLPIKFAFLPVNRMAALLIFPINPMTEICTRFCGHGQCLTYTNTKHMNYCRCGAGWSGIDCTISYDCHCPTDALCVGTVNNRSSCLCPVHKFGPRCILPSICQSKPCKNDGLCTPDVVDPYRFTCRCQQRYSGGTCEQIDTEIVISFNNIEIPQSILSYVITVYGYQKPTFTVLSTRIPYDKDGVSFYFSHPFHIVLSLIRTDYYLAVLRENYTNSTLIETQISPSRRCPPVRELLKTTWPLLRRVKSYHSICRKRIELACFHDEDIFMCLCTNERHANCFNFDFNETSYQCRSLHDCQHNASCFQDRPCPYSVMCICSECYYGSKCQFTTKGFGLNLDTILGYQIRPNVPLNRQPISVKLSLIMTIIMFIISVFSGIISVMTFKSQEIRKFGCGIYLLSSSIITLILMTIFILKFLFLLLTQMSLVTNRTIVYINCVSMDYFLRSFLAMIDWLNACIAIERIFIVIKGANFDKKKSKLISRWIILFIIILTLLSIIHDPIHRRLIDDIEEGRTWCIVQYSSHNILEMFNSIINIFHFLIPFLTNILSAFIFIIFITRIRSSSREQYSYKQHLREQCLYHKHLLISPILLIILALPRLIISFLSSCMKSIRDPWLYLIGYFISFIPSLLHIIVFILPSKVYKEELINVIGRIRHRLFCSK